MNQYFAVKQNFEYNEFDDRTRAIESGDWLFIITHDYVPGLFIKVDDFRFINQGDSYPERKIKFNGWAASIDSIRDDQNLYSFRLDFRFIAPDGRIRRIDVGNYTGYKNIIQSMKKLIELSKFQNWEQYDVMIENEKLKTINQTLLTEIEELKILIEKLKNGDK